MSNKEHVMNSSDKFWSILWGLGAIAVIVLVLTVGGYNAHLNELKATAIRENATPAQIVCAFNPPADYLAKATVCGVKPDEQEVSND